MESESDYSTSDSDTEELEIKISELEEKLSDSPYFYEGHVELIGLHRGQGNLEKAREARQCMSKIFPLTEELWLEWLSDEVPLCEPVQEDIDRTRQLFELAVQDYLSVMVWLQYAQFAMDNLSAVPEGLAFPREVFERAIVACGLHIGQSGLIWDAYVALELAILSSLQDSGSAGDDSNSETKQLVEAQRERVQKLYRRRLSVCHIGMEKGLQEYQAAFPEVGVTAESVPGYSRAKSKLDEYLPFENSLLTSDPPSLDSYRSYLDHLTSSKADPFLVNVLYQRAVAHHCLDSQLWKDFLGFLDSNFSSAGNVLLPGYRLAVRNCPWEVEFWVGLIRGMERNEAPHDDIVDTFESSLVDTFSSPEDYLNMWTCYVDYYRRRVAAKSVEGKASGSPKGEKRAELLELFRRARNKLKMGMLSKSRGQVLRMAAVIHTMAFLEEPQDIPEEITENSIKAAISIVKLSYQQTAFIAGRNNLDDEIKTIQTHFGVHGDPKDLLSRYHATMATSAAEGRSIWDNVMTRHGREAQYWLDFIDYVRRRQSEENCRKFFQQAVNSVTDDPGRMCEAYLQYEREQGSLETFETAVKRTRTQMERIKEREKSSAGKTSQKKDQSWWKPREPPRKPHAPQDGQQLGKKRPGKTSGKKEGGDAGDRGKWKKDGQRKRKAANMEDGGEKVEEMKPRKLQRVSREGEDLSASDAHPKLAMKDEPSPVAMDTSTAETKKRPNLASLGKKEERTVFVSNLSPTITEDQLKHHFSQCGDILDIRLVRSKRGPSVNTFAYLEFGESPSVWKALNLDRSSLLDRNIFVSPFRDQGEKAARPVRTYDNSCTVYVNNLQRDASEESLKELFQQCGQVKEVRLVKAKSGRPKGYAYIEYTDKSSALEAVKQLDSHQMGLKKIGVAMSAPRKTGESQATSGDGGGAGGDGGEGKMAIQDESGFMKPTFIPRRALQQSTDAPIPRRSKTNVMLVPRVLAKAGGESKEEPNEESSKGKMSNDDFRKLYSSSK